MTSAQAAARFLLSALNEGNYVSVDGGAYEIAVLTPTIVGIVMPSLSIAFGAPAASVPRSPSLATLGARRGVAGFPRRPSQVR